MSVEKLIAEIRELDRDTVPVKATFESGLPPEEFLYLKRNHILTLCRIIEVQREALNHTYKDHRDCCNEAINKSDLDLHMIKVAKDALAESDRIAKEGKE